MWRGDECACHSVPPSTRRSTLRAPSASAGKRTPPGRESTPDRSPLLSVAPEQLSVLPDREDGGVEDLHGDTSKPGLRHELAQILFVKEGEPVSRVEPLLHRLDRCRR